jgi:DmsE family decaheme c-type cytochrome
MGTMQRLLVAWVFAGGLILGNSAMAQDRTPQAEAAKAPQWKGDAVCTHCHDETASKPILLIYQTKHGVKGDARTPGCQSCHGTSDNHLKDKQLPTDVAFGANKSDARTQDAACLTCHKADKRTHWTGGQHQVNDVSCSGCHVVHAAVDKVRNRKTQTEVCFTCHQEQRADSLKVSAHPIDAGKVICSDCHNPHGSAGPKLVKKNTVLETCFSCHAEKRGPFLWEHQPVTEDCTNCHTPHGSNISPLLKSRAPFLCDECHDGPHNSASPYGSGAAVGRPGASAGFGDRMAAGRACMNCHSMVHGSNSPSGAFLHR